MRHVFILSTCLFLVACSRPSDPWPDRADACGAAAFSAAVGQPAVALALPTDRPVRVIAPGQPVTMDYNAERLNVLVDSVGIVTELRCG
ncbi:hypothetical protein KUH32_09475 [Thalassococcus sp. CAU 1522]|uniref:Peptidase inhibitor I78 family protein n=1 Tax=Thalassococcus arenae TaxID=2851652 RepID=A0ABS6N7K5_9RHOB|nr:I78 family peptidase inhibitor [Thalassococcus arenae]MBV2360004.1 hypothetical protein [Thalassococcus arenae]